MANHHGDLDLDTADRLLSGRLDADDAPPEYRAVAQLFHDAQREPVPYRGSDDALLAAMVDAIVANDFAPRTRMLPRILALKVAAIAVVALSATAAAAATGSLPDAAQDGLARAAQHVGINLPSSANDNARERTEDRGPKADEPVNTPASTAGVDDDAETDGPNRGRSAGTADPTAPAPLAGGGTDAQPPAAATTMVRRSPTPPTRPIRPAGRVKRLPPSPRTTTAPKPVPNTSPSTRKPRRRAARTRTARCHGRQRNREREHQQALRCNGRQASTGMDGQVPGNRGHETG